MKDVQFANGQQIYQFPIFFRFSSIAFKCWGKSYTEHTVQD